MAYVNYKINHLPNLRYTVAQFTLHKVLVNPDKLPNLFESTTYNYPCILDILSYITLSTNNHSLCEKKHRDMIVS